MILNEMQLNNLRNVTIHPSIWSRFISLSMKQTMNRTINSSSLLTYSNSYLKTSQLIVKIKPKIDNNLLIKNININKGLASVLLRNLSSKEMPFSSETGSDDDIKGNEDEDIFDEPPRVRFGMIKVMVTIILGAYFGALFAMFGANFLEEYEIFVKGDDEEDD